MERKQIQFTRQQLAGLRREARRRHVSESALVREAVDRLLGHDEALRRERVARALSVIGKFRSGGDRDIAREHDRELANIYFEDIRGKR